MGLAFSAGVVSLGLGTFIPPSCLFPTGIWDRARLDLRRGPLACLFLLGRLWWDAGELRPLAACGVLVWAGPNSAVRATTPTTTRTTASRPRPSPAPRGGMALPARREPSRAAARRAETHGRPLGHGRATRVPTGEGAESLGEHRGVGQAFLVRDVKQSAITRTSSGLMPAWPILPPNRVRWVPEGKIAQQQLVPDHRRANTRRRAGRGPHPRLLWRGVERGVRAATAVVSSWPLVVRRCLLFQRLVWPPGRRCRSPRPSAQLPGGVATHEDLPASGRGGRWGDQAMRETHRLGERRISRVACAGCTRRGSGASPESTRARSPPRRIRTPGTGGPRR